MKRCSEGSDYVPSTPSHSLPTPRIAPTSPLDIISISSVSPSPQINPKQSQCGSQQAKMRVKQVEVATLSTQKRKRLGQIRITRQKWADEVQYITELPVNWTVPDDPTKSIAYIIDYSQHPKLYQDDSGKPLSMSAILKAVVSVAIPIIRHSLYFNFYYCRTLIHGVVVLVAHGKIPPQSMHLAELNARLFPTPAKADINVNMPLLIYGLITIVIPTILSLSGLFSKSGWS